MKTRQGFVSNSSSSSYIVLLPEDIENELPADEPQEIVKLLFKLTIDGRVWEEDEDTEAYNDLLQRLDNYIVATMDSPSDQGSIVLCDSAKVRKIINEK